MNWLVVIENTFKFNINQGRIVNEKVTILEDLLYEYEIYENITSGTTGTVTVPTGATIRLDQYPNAGDCLITKVGTDNRPIDEPPRTATGVEVTATFDNSGNYILSGTPVSYPVSIIYQVAIKGKDIGNISLDSIVDWTDVSSAAQVTYDNVMSGTTSTNVQDVIDEVVSEKQNNLTGISLSVLKACIIIVVRATSPKVPI